MLEANKSKWFEKIFTIYNRNLIKRRFHSIKVCGLETLKSNDFQFPLITFSNHSSWWDGLILFEIFSHFEFENFVMMEEKQLKDLRLFRKLGAFSIVRENPKEALKSIKYAVKKLQDISRSNLWIFPQGEILPNEIRPLNFYNGISKIIEKCGSCRVLPISLKFEFRNEFKPEIFVKIGKYQQFEKISKSESKALTKTLEKDLTLLLDSLRSDLIEGNLETYENLL
jgi:1-acyl-sn-glycerol-3-phosphate acyltransferase